MLKSSLLYKIINGIWDMCFIWKTEMRNVFRDEGVLIFCILVPLGYPLLYSWIYNNEVVRHSYCRPEPQPYLAGVYSRI